MIRYLIVDVSGVTVTKKCIGLLMNMAAFALRDAGEHGYGGRW